MTDGDRSREVKVRHEQKGRTFEITTAVRTLMDRAEALCSSGVIRTEEVKRLQKALEKNG